MAKQSKSTRRSTTDAKPRPVVTYEPVRLDRGSKPESEPRLGPYEFRYDIDFGYSPPTALA